MSSLSNVSSMIAAPPRPEPTTPREYHFPAFSRHQLASGASLLVAPVTKLPIVTVMVVMEAGATRDPAGREGLALLTAAAVLEGTESLSGDELTERLEGMGAALDASADWDVAFLRLTVLSSRLGDALTLLGDSLRAPAFPERDIERLRNERLAEILQQRAEPRGLADEMFDRFIYEPDARYAHPDGGTEASVGAIGREDIVRFWRDHWQPGSANVIVVGDVSADFAQRELDRAFEGWIGETAPNTRRSDTPAAIGRATRVVARTDAPQSEIRVGHVGVPRRHPDYFPLVVMNAILGGLFSSRINLNLREEHAFTYGAFSGFDWRREAGPFVISTAVRSDVTDQAAKEILKEVERMRAEPVTNDELSLATSYLDGVFPIRYETTSAIASALANLAIYGLPEDYFDRYRNEVRAVTAERVLAAARAHLDPERLQLVVVGDAPVVRGPLEASGFGQVSVYDASGSALEISR